MERSQKAGCTDLVFDDLASGEYHGIGEHKLSRTMALNMARKLRNWEPVLGPGASIQRRKAFVPETLIDPATKLELQEPILAVYDYQKTGALSPIRVVVTPTRLFRHAPGQGLNLVEVKGPSSAPAFPNMTPMVCCETFADKLYIASGTNHLMEWDGQNDLAYPSATWFSAASLIVPKKSVEVATGTFKIPGNTLEDGDEVVYEAKGDTVLGGLISGALYVVCKSANTTKTLTPGTFKLKTPFAVDPLPLTGQGNDTQALVQVSADDDGWRYPSVVARHAGRLFLSGFKGNFDSRMGASVRWTESSDAWTLCPYWPEARTADADIVTAMASTALGDRLNFVASGLIIAKAGSTFLLSGNDFATYSDLALIELSPNTGCAGPASWTYTGTGIAMLGAAGIFEITRQLQLKDVPMSDPVKDAIENRPGLAYSSATYDPDAKQAFFLLPVTSGTGWEALVWNEVRGAWFSWDNRNRLEEFFTLKVPYQDTSLSGNLKLPVPDGFPDIPQTTPWDGFLACPAVWCRHQRRLVLCSKGTLYTYGQLGGDEVIESELHFLFQDLGSRFGYKRTRHLDLDLTGDVEPILACFAVDERDLPTVKRWSVPRGPMMWGTDVNLNADDTGAIGFWTENPDLCHWDRNHAQKLRFTAPQGSLGGLTQAQVLTRGRGSITLHQAALSFVGAR